LSVTVSWRIIREADAATVASVRVDVSRVPSLL